MSYPDERIAAAVLRIDPDAIVANYRTIADRVTSARIAAVVKADAYGLGAERVGHALAGAGCRDFFVAHLCEAITLRGSLSGECRIYVLNGLAPGSEAECAALGIVPVLNSLDHLWRWAAVARVKEQRLAAVLQVDSGMSRLGFSGAELGALHADVEWAAYVEPVLLMTHLACADDLAASANRAQLAAFEKIAASFPGVPRSIANSGGAFLGPDFGGDLVRAGIALYGGAPDCTGPSAMRPVVSLTAHIIQLREVPAGTGVGYGLGFLTDRPTRLATIGVGYADGWSRAFGNRGAVAIGGVLVPVAGRVSMDSMTLDVTDVPENIVVPGAPVELIGPNRTLEQVAAEAGTISYEILTQLGARYAREYGSLER